MPHSLYFFFFFNDTATTEIYTLSLHDALPISGGQRARPREGRGREPARVRAPGARRAAAAPLRRRSGGDRRWQPRRHGRGAPRARGEACVRSRDHTQIGRASCREKSVDLGGRRIIKKKKRT